MAAKIYRTLANDSFDKIAFRLWGSEHYMKLLLDANPAYMDCLLFEPGIELVIPDFTPEVKTPGSLPPWYGEASEFQSS